MAVNLYRIKLYGHSGGDTELFCNNLSSILNIDLERARTLVRDAPVIIKEGIEKEKAEEFCKLLEPTRALCIVEPLDAQIVEDPSSTAIAPKPLPVSPTDSADLKKQAALSSQIWMVALIVAIGVFLLFVGGGFISSLMDTYRQHRTPATSPERSARPTGNEAELSSADAGPVSLEDLQVQIDALETRIESNRFRLTQAEEAQDGLLRSPRSESNDFEQMAAIIRGLRNQIRNDAGQLQILKQKRQEIEARQE